MDRKTAFDILQNELEKPILKTTSKNLDGGLKGGLELSIITELCGLAGSGKTQLCFQLCVNVQIPKEAGGIGGKAVFVDTNQGFNAKRIKEISNSLQEASPNETDINVESILENILYFYIDDYVALIALIEHFKIWLKENSEIKLIVIDSFSYLFRSFCDSITRTRTVNQLLRDLKIMAFDLQIAVIITNELTTRLFEEESIICPALGDNHGHTNGQRILLGNHPTNNIYKIAFLEKTLYCDSCSILFKITQHGLK